MDAGPAGVATSLGSYAIGLAVSYVMGFIITNAVVREDEVAELYHDETPDAQQDADSGALVATAPQASPASADNDLPSVGSPVGPAIVHGQPVALEGMILLAPADGQLIAQKQISDKTFREGYLGSCFGIVPSEGAVYAPCSGVVALETESHYAFVIEDLQGQRVMIHVGIGTVNMNGEGFEPRRLR